MIIIDIFKYNLLKFNIIIVIFSFLIIIINIINDKHDKLQ